jgi:hypothetical protein
MYTACRRYLSREEPSSDVLAALPAPAVELFTAQPSDGGVGFTIPRCVDLTIDEARQVGDVLRAAGFEQDGAMPDPFASEAIRDGNVTIRTREVSIDLTPQLPHGEPAQCCGGIG